MITPPPAGGRVSSINFSICELGLSQEGLLPRDDIIKRVPIVFIKKKKKKEISFEHFNFSFVYVVNPLISRRYICATKFPWQIRQAKKKWISSKIIQVMNILTWRYSFSTSIYLTEMKRLRLWNGMSHMHVMLTANPRIYPSTTMNNTIFLLPTDSDVNHSLTSPT